MDITRRRWLIGSLTLTAAVTAAGQHVAGAASKPTVTVHKSPT